jgi:hypothetical protein
MSNEAVEILQPVIALVLWSLAMMTWMYATRLPAMRRAGMLGDREMGQRPGSLDVALPPRIQWKAHNYNHLMEQPTLFYAVALTLALVGTGKLELVFAWAYVGLRILHSLVQATSNIVALRFSLFIAASLALAVITVSAAARLW